ncbi:MAG: molybdate ABC transporter permease subunit [Actinomycetaceae bacterium]|nr:molybdate ABC transporter permease subunit [Actinomycetaceae bacterium]
MTLVRSSSQRGVTYPRWLIIPATVALLFLIVPMIAVFIRTPWTDFFPLLATEEAQDALWLSLRTCIVSTIIATLVGVPLAVLLAKNEQTRWAKVVKVFVVLPMVLPPVVAGLALLLAWGRMGLLGRHLDAMGITIGFSTLAVIFAQVFVSMPFLVLSLEGALRSQGDDYDRTAQALGASRTRTFFLVSIPVMFPALISGVALSFSRALGEFGATITFAGSLQGTTRTMPLEIYLRRETATDQALALAVVLIVLAMAMFALSTINPHAPRRIRRRSRIKPTDSAASETQIAHLAGQQKGKQAPSIHVDARIAERKVDLQVDIGAGSSVSIMGDNGSGKSTLLGLISGMLLPDDGTVSFDPPGASVVLLEQRALLFPHMSVLENVEFGLRAHGVSRENARTTAMAELAIVGMSDLADRPATQLSGGQAQRVALARAMAIEPDVVLLDEPFSGLDAENVERVQESIAARLSHANVTTLMVTHDPLAAETLTEELIIIRAGRVVKHRPIASDKAKQGA